MPDSPSSRWYLYRDNARSLSSANIKLIFESTSIALITCWFTKLSSATNTVACGFDDKLLKFISKFGFNDKACEICFLWLSDSTTINGKSKFLESLAENHKIKKIVVRFLENVDEIVGADLEKYGPFKVEDIATIPYENAQALIAKNIATKVRWED